MARRFAAGPDWAMIYLPALWYAANNPYAGGALALLPLSHRAFSLILSQRKNGSNFHFTFPDSFFLIYFNIADINRTATYERFLLSARERKTKHSIAKKTKQHNPLRWHRVVWIRSAPPRVNKRDFTAAPAEFLCKQTFRCKFGVSLWNMSELTDVLGASAS